MNFALDETQADLRDLAAEVFGRRVTPARLDQVEATTDRFDRELWAELARAGLLGVAVGERDGGLGLGMVELALACEQLGRVVAAVPFVTVTTAAAVLAVCGDERQRSRWLPATAAGDAIVVATPPSSATQLRVEGDQLFGALVAVPWAHVADELVVPAGGRLFLLNPAAAGVRSARGQTTAREVAVDYVLDGVAAEQVGDAGAADLLRQRWLTAWAAVQAGVTDAALRLTADYTSRREQFNKPLSTFQGVALKAADAYLDVQAIRAAALQAAWSLDSGVDPTLAVLTAAWWAAEAGQHCVHVTQHLHGGMGADVTYPVHRYFLWGKQIELLCGGASALVAELGDALDGRRDAGDALVLDPR